MTRDNVCSRLQFCNAHVTVDSSYYIVNTRNKKLLLLKNTIFFHFTNFCSYSILEKDFSNMKCLKYQK